MLLTASNLFGAYEIKIAKYKNHTYLMLEMAKIKASEYRKNIVIEKRNDFYYVTSTRYESENKVKKALGVYKKMFPDAFIAEVEVKSEQKVIVVAPIEVAAEIPESKIPEPQSPEPIKNEQLASLDAKQLLENKTVYICNENGSKKAQKEVIRLDFKKEYVIYTKLSKSVSPIEIPYTFDQDCVILPMSGIDFKYQIYKEEDAFLSAKSFTNDKEGNHFRYYFDEDMAFKFIRRP